MAPAIRPVTGLGANGEGTYGVTEGLGRFSKDGRERAAPEPGALGRRISARRRRRALFATGVVVALLIGWGATERVRDGGLFGTEARHCWDAWEPDDAPFLADAWLGEAGHRTGTSQGPERGEGECTVSITSSDRDDLRSEIEVVYGPAPEGTDERFDWLLGHLGGAAVLVPDGLPGAVTAESGLLVLPKRCDTADGRPTTVSLTAKSTRSWNNGRRATSSGLGGVDRVARLLVAAADAAMHRAGCGGPRQEVRSPVLNLPEDAEKVFWSSASSLCRIPGLAVDRVTADSLDDQRVGVVGPELQTCVVTRRHGAEPYLSAVMVARPGLLRLFEGLAGDGTPAPGWRGTGSLAGNRQVVRTECGDRRMGFLMTGTSEEQAAAFTNSAADRLGCAAVAPRP
ncbi:hypothetical protein ACIP88_23815 [Streptomyces uncialis]|uniref:hypothetical protein n=1 Tax=Streptomyces uncialis TaxID=1048205 RepID=UPI0038261D4E